MALLGRREFVRHGVEKVCLVEGEQLGGGSGMVQRVGLVVVETAVVGVGGDDALCQQGCNGGNTVAPRNGHEGIGGYRPTVQHVVPAHDALAFAGQMFCHLAHKPSLQLGVSSEAKAAFKGLAAWALLPRLGGAGTAADVYIF